MQDSIMSIFWLAKLTTYWFLQQSLVQELPRKITWDIILASTNSVLLIVEKIKSPLDHKQKIVRANSILMGSVQSKQIKQS